eukprot:Skav205901  [mRNA]  locus=scaffold123:296449:297252:+ [translate_table: standard]
MIRCGASPSQQSGSSEASFFLSWEIEVPYAGHSCFSFIRELLIAYHRDKSWGWYEEIDYLDEVLVRIARAPAKQQARPRASVDEGIVELWEKYLHDTASHDLTIEAADAKVTAHSGMLKQASPVVQAMLASPMAEGKSQRIQVKDTSSSAVTLFLQALYTCSSQGDPDYQTALSALDLAHRWQVEVVVAILADLIQKLITEESFHDIAEHAALKQLDTLQQACRKFGSECAAIQDKIKKGQFPRVVQDLFQVVKTSQHQPVKKRKLL